MKISILVPTKSRPKELQRFINSLITHTQDLSSIELVLAVNSDDDSTTMVDFKNLSVVIVRCQPNSSMGYFNSAALNASFGEIVILGNDDIVIRTYGWDGIVRSVHKIYPDLIYLAYPNDLFKGKKLATFPIISRITCELLQEPFPKIYQKGFIDTHLMDIFLRLKQKGCDRIIYCDHLIFEHLHYRVGKSLFDATYEKGRLLRFVDDSSYLALVNARKSLAINLLNFIQGKYFKNAEKYLKINLPSNPLLYFLKASHIILMDDGIPVCRRLPFALYFLVRNLFSKCIKVKSFALSLLNSGHN